jgi:hypothetical protein
MPLSPIRIAGAQGFYGDSPQAALAIAREKGADYLMHDALAELTLSILQKDKLRDPSLGYAQDIEVLGRTLIPLAFKNGIKVVTNSGGLNPASAANRLTQILDNQGVKGLKIAYITGDDMLSRIDELLESGEKLEHLDFKTPYEKDKYQLTNANVYIGAKSIVEALANGADVILAGRVADPALTLGILCHHYGWKLEGDLSQADLDKLASGIAIGHIIECGGQASGGNSYAEFPQEYELWNLGYPIAHVYEDGSAIITKLESQGGKVSRNTVREQLVYEIHDPANYITPDVTVDLTQIKLEEIAPNQVKISGIKGKPRPEKLKLAMGHLEGFLTESFSFFTYPYAYQKAVRWEDSVRKIWANMPYLKINKMEFQYIGLGAIHQGAVPLPNSEYLENLQEIGLRIVIQHDDEKTGKLAMSAITCLGLNGSPGVCGMPGWGKINRGRLGLYPTLIPRHFIQEEINYIIY